MTFEEAAKLIKEHGDRATLQDDVVLIGVRGFHDFGVKGKNDRGIYDDKLIWVCKSMRFISSFTANVDPSAYRKGVGKGHKKGMASLKNGIWRYKPGPHNGYPAFRQAADVVVIRDGEPPYEDKGQFGINIHMGGVYGTSSLGCQTTKRSEWKDFKKTGDDLLKYAKQSEFSYMLIDKGDLK
jgi:hypothetical protein